MEGRSFIRNRQKPDDHGVSRKPADAIAHIRSRGRVFCFPGGKQKKRNAKKEKHLPSSAVSTKMRPAVRRQQQLGR
jgi:hypothetical protein